MSKLLPDKIKAILPALYAQEHDDDPVVFLKFFTPDSSWTWLITEGSPQDDDFLFFGYVIGFEAEWGYSLLSELATARGPRGLPIERDLHFRPDKFSAVLRRENR